MPKLGLINDKTLDSDSEWENNQYEDIDNGIDARNLTDSTASNEGIPELVPIFDTTLNNQSSDQNDSNQFTPTIL